MKSECCQEQQECLANEDCACFVGCVGMMNPPDMCAMQCQIANPGQVPEIANFVECVMGSCGQECGG